MIIHNADITGSLKINEIPYNTGSFNGVFDGVSTFASNAGLLNGNDSTTFATTGSNTFIGNQTISGSLDVTGSIYSPTISGSFIGDGSGLRNLPIPVIDTGSLATTGSNVFTGNQTISGSVTATTGFSGSFSGSFQGNGAQITNLAIPDPLSVNRLRVGGAHGALGGCATIAGGFYNTASNNCSTVSGGDFNGATGQRSTVGGGALNNASGYRVNVAGGQNNTAGASFSTVLGGCNNTANANFATVGGGRANRASNGFAVVAGGCNNCVTGYRGVIVGGESNTANSTNSGILGGVLNHTCGFANSFIIGSNLCATAACTTFMNNNCVIGSVTAANFRSISGELNVPTSTTTTIYTFNNTDNMAGIFNIRFVGTSVSLVCFFSKTWDGASPRLTVGSIVERDGLNIQILNENTIQVSHNVGVTVLGVWTLTRVS
jgi:hypothetical protein